MVHVGVDIEQYNETDDFTRLRTGLTARAPIGTPVGRYQPDILWYGLHEWYIDAPGGPINGEEGSGSAYQFELGLTFGTTEKVRLWRIPLPRVGFGFRFGGDTAVYRLVFGSPF